MSLGPGALFSYFERGARLARTEWNPESRPHEVFAVKGRLENGTDTIVMCNIVGKTIRPLRELPISELYLKGWYVVPKEAHADLAELP